jgi:hypothetical protein
MKPEVRVGCFVTHLKGIIREQEGKEGAKKMKMHGAASVPHLTER